MAQSFIAAHISMVEKWKLYEKNTIETAKKNLE